MAPPAYLQILQVLRARIAKGEWGIGTQIPTDEELMRQFGVSRFTVRAALDVLVADGVIKRYRRRGSFVVGRAPDAGTWMLTSLDDLVSSSFPTPPILLEAATVRCARPVADALGLDDDPRALRISALRVNDGAAYAFSVIHIPHAYARALPADWRQRVDKEPFISLVLAANGLTVHRAIQVAQAVGATGEVAERLGVAENSPVLLLERTFLAREGTALEHAQIYCRPDRYRQIIEFRSGDAVKSRQPSSNRSRRPRNEEKNIIAQPARTLAQGGARHRSIRDRGGTT